MDQDFKKKLREAVVLIKKKTGLTQAEISAKAGYRNNTITQAISKENGHETVYKRLELAFPKILTKSTSQPETSIATEENQTPDETYLTRRRLLKQNHNKKIPFYDAAANGGAEIYYSEMTPVSAPAGTIDVGDLLNDSECALRVYGNSMIPNYPPGCVVGLIKCTKSFIEPGEVYVIETIDRRVIKRLFYKNDDPETSTFTCYSDNTLKFEGGARDGKQAYPIFNIELKDIINLYQVTGVIKRNSNSVIINR